MEIQFFRQRHALLTSFDIFVVTYRVTNFLPKLINMLLFSTEKTEFPFLVFPYFRVMPLALTRICRCSLFSPWRSKLLGSSFLSGNKEHLPFFWWRKRHNVAAKQEAAQKVLMPCALPQMKYARCCAILLAEFVQNILVFPRMLVPQKSWKMLSNHTKT